MQTPGLAVHSLSALQPRHVFVGVAQIGVVPEQVVLSTQATQAPALVPLVAHAGEPPLATHWLDAVQAVQLFADEQIGVVPLHALSARHWTHLFAAVSQKGLPATLLQSLFCVHWTQAPAFAPVVAQAGAAPDVAVLHSLAELQAAQVCDAEQIGVAPEQSEWPRQRTQVFVAVSQRGLSPPQWLSSVH